MKSKVKRVEAHSLLQHLSSSCEDLGLVPRTKEERKGMRRGEDREKQRGGKKENYISKEKHQRLSVHVHGIIVNRLGMDFKEMCVHLPNHNETPPSLRS